MNDRINDASELELAKKKFKCLEKLIADKLSNDDYTPVPITCDINMLQKLWKLSTQYYERYTLQNQFGCLDDNMYNYLMKKYSLICLSLRDCKVK